MNRTQQSRKVIARIGSWWSSIDEQAASRPFHASQMYEPQHQEAHDRGDLTDTNLCTATMAA